MTKKANFWPNLAVFGPKNLISIGRKHNFFPEKRCLSPKIALERLKLLSHTSAKPNVWMPIVSVITFRITGLAWNLLVWRCSLTQFGLVELSCCHHYLGKLLLKVFSRNNVNKFNFPRFSANSRFSALPNANNTSKTSSTLKFNRPLKLSELI